MEWFYSIRTEQRTELFKGITFFANTKTIIWLCIILLVIPKINKKIGIPIAATAIVGSALNRTIKHTVMRPRPEFDLQLIHPGGFSFTSGHSSSSIMMYGLLVWLIRRYVKDKRIANIATVILTLLWICIGISRMYLGVHYPTDVMGGWTLGMIVMLVTITLVEKIECRKLQKLQH
jgi:undecaprenyl-diphosphatase